jgi:hypothetical protein
LWHEFCWLESAGMQGFPDQATSLAATAVEDALATDHENAVCYSLVEGACPIALFTRDFELAKRLVSQLLDRSTRYGLTTWQVLGRSFDAELLIRCGDTAIGLARLQTRSRRGKRTSVVAAFARTSWCACRSLCSDWACLRSSRRSSKQSRCPSAPVCGGAFPSFCEPPPNWAALVPAREVRHGFLASEFQSNNNRLSDIPGKKP